MCQNANFMRKISISILNVSNGTQKMPWSATHCCGGGSFSSNSGQLNQFILSSTCSFFPHIPIQLVEPSESPESTEISKSFWNLQWSKKLVKRIQSTKVVSNKFIDLFFSKRREFSRCVLNGKHWLTLWTKKQPFKSDSGFVFDNIFNVMFLKWWVQMFTYLDVVCEQ